MKIVHNGGDCMSAKQPFLNTLPHDLWASIFSHLYQPHDVLNASLACKSFDSIIHKKTCQTHSSTVADYQKTQQDTSLSLPTQFALRNIQQVYALGSGFALSLEGEMPNTLIYQRRGEHFVVTQALGIPGGITACETIADASVSYIGSGAGILYRTGFRGDRLVVSVKTRCYTGQPIKAMTLLSDDEIALSNGKQVDIYRHTLKKALFSKKVKKAELKLKQTFVPNQVQKFSNITIASLTARSQQQLLVGDNVSVESWIISKKKFGFEDYFGRVGDCDTLLKPAVLSDGSAYIQWGNCLRKYDVENEYSDTEIRAARSVVKCHGNFFASVSPKGQVSVTSPEQHFTFDDFSLTSDQRLARLANGDLVKVGKHDIVIREFATNTANPSAAKVNTPAS